MIYSYRRVSTDEQHNGPQAQSDAIASWGRHGETLAGDFFDEGVSGGIPLEERPAGCALMEALKNGDTIVVAKLDRLFRSVVDAAQTISGWTARNINLVCIAEGFDMTNPYGRAMAQMASVFAELEREMIRSRTKAALASKKARGECVGEVPYGWDRVGNNLVKNREEQEVIIGIETLANNLMTPKQIAKHLNDYGLKAKKGGKWHATQVRRIIEAEKLRRDCG